MVLPVVQTDFITVVSGLPRSGTSLMMQILAAGGVPIVTDNLRLPDASNPRGYFEFDPVKRLRSDQTWLRNARGRAIKIITMLLRELPADGVFQYRVLCMRRPFPEVISSQRVMLEQQGKKSADEAQLLNIYRQQLGQIETWLATKPCFRLLNVQYHDLLKRPVEISRQISAFLESPLDIEAMASAVDQTLCHQRSGEIGEE